MANEKYVVITPVRDEVQYIGQTIAAMSAQVVKPAQWVIVDDGSSDGTGELLDRAAEANAWITVVHRRDRGHRASGGGVVEAVNTGLAAVREGDWEYLVKLDGDLSFAPDYFENCLQQFRREPKLGIGGGTVCKLVDGQATIDSQGDPVFHVRGATKIYRRACWDQISPLAQAPGWDTIDEVTANFHGWMTRTFVNLTVIQHKPTGSADGLWRNCYKNGYANYMTGYHPLFMLAKCVKRAGRRPPLVESAALWAGFCSGYVKRIPKLCRPDVIRFLRRQQIQRLLHRPSIYSVAARS